MLMYSFRISNKKQAGETIVEVLISILVISVALAGAFAISNRSQKTIQANQERYQAQIMANSQADLLKNYVSSNPRPTIPQFCITLLGVPSTNYDSQCKDRDPNGLPNGLYDISITCGTNPCTSDQYSVYKITVTWDSLISSGGQDNVELWYGV